MATKIPPPQNVTKESDAASAAAKALEKNKAAQGTAKKKIFDPKRDPKTYSQDELLQMMENGEINAPAFTDENLMKFVLGEITWAELTGLTMQDAYSFAEIAR